MRIGATIDAEAADDADTGYRRAERCLGGRIANGAPRRRRLAAPPPSMRDVTRTDRPGSALAAAAATASARHTHSLGMCGACLHSAGHLSCQN